MSILAPILARCFVPLIFFYLSLLFGSLQLRCDLSTREQECLFCLVFCAFSWWHSLLSEISLRKQSLFLHVYSLVLPTSSGSPTALTYTIIVVPQALDFFIFYSVFVIFRLGSNGSHGCRTGAWAYFRPDTSLLPQPGARKGCRSQTRIGLAGLQPTNDESRLTFLT